jgi:glyoxylase-like metal-dependent hydrolase (beta-lactamase superfamily II)
VGSILLKVIATPGHTLGGVVLYCESEKVAFTGDTLFRGSVGRTDLYGGSYAQLMTSVKKIKNLPPDTALMCGHGDSTTVQFEMEHNPYL